jgi:hypothetical protein
MLVPVPKAVPGTRAGSANTRSQSTRAGAGQTISLGAPPLRDQELLAWCEELVEAVLGGLTPAGSAQAEPGTAGDGPEGQG